MAVGPTAGLWESGLPNVYQVLRSFNQGYRPNGSKVATGQEQMQQVVVQLLPCPWVFPVEPRAVVATFSE